MSNEREEKRFLRKFFNGVLLLVAMIAVGFSSYKGVFWYCEFMNAKGKSITFSKKKDKIYNTILVEDKENNRVEGAIVQMMNQKLNTVDCVVIPANTKIPISGDVYQELKENGKVLMDVTTLQSISSADLEKSEEYRLIVKAIGEILNIDSLEAYEVHDQAILSKWMQLIEKQGEQVKFDVPMMIMSEKSNGEKDIIHQGEQILDGNKVNSVVFFNQYQDGALDQAKIIAQLYGQCYQKVGTWKEEEKNSLYQELYKDMVSNQERKAIDEQIKGLTSATDVSFHFHMLNGYDSRDSFEGNDDKNKELIKNIAENQEAYTSKQDLSIFEVEPIALSTDLSIKIYNGTKIPGLATEWKKKLEDNGYHKIIGLGNDNAIPKEETIIYVKADGVGYDLYGYFPKAKFVVDPSLDGMDIKIVIGRLDGERE